MKYSYRCTAGHITTRDYPMGKAEKFTICEECGGEAQKIPSRPAIIVKGSGTDNSGNRNQNTVR